MRLFTAVNVPEPILDTLEAFVAPLRFEVRARWSPREKLHITTKFVGEWQEERLPELVDALEKLSAEPFEVQLSGLGAFPRVLWVGIRPSSGLQDLAARTEDALAALGCPRENRPFTPHLTLARERDGVRLEPMADRALPPLPPFSVDCFHLYQSAGGGYQQLRTFRFVRSSK